MRQLTNALILTLLLIPILSTAQPHYGANISIPIIATEPSTLHGYQIMGFYDPERFQWRQFNVYFDAGFSHFTQTDTPYHSTINIYSAAPVIRYTFKKHGPVHPYLELSIGAAYLNQTRFANRNLGIHFAFQDRMGVGMLLGEAEKFTVGIHAVHYSNAHLSDHNSGITVPLALDVGYRFQ